MDFELSEQQKLLKQNARSFMEREVIPAAKERDRRGPLSRGEVQGYFRRLRPLGYISGLVPEEHGGQGLDFLSYGVILEELARAWAGLAGLTMIHSSVLLTVARLSNKEQARSFIPGLVSDDRTICLGISEPEAGSNTASIRTTAVPDGSDLVVNGTKTWISNGGVADIALVLAITEPEQGRGGMSFLLIDKEASPFTSRELPKIGLKAWSTAELSFQECRVPRGNLLGTPGDGYRMTLVAFEHLRCGVATLALGLAQASLEAALRYAQERRQFGKAIGSFQLIQEMIFDMLAETEAARFLTFRAWALLDKGVRCDREAAMAKAYATEMAVAVTSKAIQIHGAYGLSEEYPVERYFRDARTLTIPDGTTQIMKLLVGRSALGLSAFV